MMDTCISNSNDNVDGPMVSNYISQPKRRKSSPPVRIVRPAKFLDDSCHDDTEDEEDDHLYIDENKADEDPRPINTHISTDKYPINTQITTDEQSGPINTQIPENRDVPDSMTVSKSSPVRPQPEKLKPVHIRPFEYDNNKTSPSYPVSMLQSMVERFNPDNHSNQIPTDQTPTKSAFTPSASAFRAVKPSIAMETTPVKPIQSEQSTSAFKRVLPKPTVAVNGQQINNGDINRSNDNNVGFKPEDALNMNFMQNAMMMQNPMMLAAMNPFLAPPTMNGQQMMAPPSVNNPQLLQMQHMFMLQMQMMMNPFNTMWQHQTQQQQMAPLAGFMNPSAPLNQQTTSKNANGNGKPGKTTGGKKTTYPCMYCSKIIKGQKRFDAHVKMHQKKMYDVQQSGVAPGNQLMSNNFMSHMFMNGQFPLSPIPTKFPSASTPIVNPSPLLSSKTTNGELMIPNGHSSPKVNEIGQKRKRDDIEPSVGVNLSKKMDVSPPPTSSEDPSPSNSGLDLSVPKIKIEVVDTMENSADKKKSVPFVDSSDSIHSPESSNSATVDEQSKVNSLSLSSESASTSPDSTVNNDNNSRHESSYDTTMNEDRKSPTIPEFKGETACTFCGIILTSAEIYAKHIETHLTERNYKCSLCHLVFASVVARKQHEKVHTEQSNLFKCPFCPKTFVQRTTLRHHTRVHTGEKPYRCPYCEMSFAHHKSRVHHIRTHTGERPYECHICQARFAQSGNLHRHMRIHEVNRGTTCNFCLQGFKAIATLERHLQTHVDNYNPNLGAQCGLCEEKFTCLITLNQHIATHRGKSFQCEQCAEKFHSDYLLNRHVRQSHRQGNLYPCEQCGKIFTNRGPLEIHRRWHNRNNNAAAVAEQQQTSDGSSPPGGSSINGSSPPGGSSINRSSSLSPEGQMSVSNNSTNNQSAETTDEDEELDVGGLDNTDVYNGYHGDTTDVHNGYHGDTSCQNDSLLHSTDCS